MKGRRYGEQTAGGAQSANRALVAALSTMLRLFAPFLPFATDEVWSWWREGSIHRAPWPTRDELLRRVSDNSEAAREADERTYVFATDVMFEVRKQRSEAKQPLKVPIVAVSLKAEPGALQLLPYIDADLRSALRVRTFEPTPGEPRQITVIGYENAPA